MMEDALKGQSRSPSSYILETDNVPVDSVSSLQIPSEDD